MKRTVPKVELKANEPFRISKWFPDLEPDVVGQLKFVYQELIKFNPIVNLVGIKTLPFADAIHFADSIHGCKIIYDNDKNITTLCDIGSGGGFPGLVFAIMYPKINVVLIDIDKRKIEFLKQTVKALELTNVSFLDKNVETLPDDSIDCAVSRGFAPIPNTIMVARKIVKKGGRYYHFKNEQWASEIAIIPTQLCSLWAPSLVSEYKLPIGDAKFSIIKTDKIG